MYKGYASRIPCIQTDYIAYLKLGLRRITFSLEFDGRAMALVQTLLGRM